MNLAGILHVFVPVLINVCAVRRAKIIGIITALSVGPWNLYIAAFEHFRGMNRPQRRMWSREQWEKTVGWGK